MINGILFGIAVYAFLWASKSNDGRLSTMFGFISATCVALGVIL